MEFNLHEFIWAIINFVILLALLYKFLYKPILNVLDKRKNEVSENLSNAETARKEAEETLARYKEELKKAKTEAEEIISSAVNKGEEKRQEIIQEARDEASNMLKRAKEEITNEKEKAIAELRDEVATLAVMAAGKVIEREIKDKDHERFVKEFVSEVGEIQ